MNDSVFTMSVLAVLLPGIIAAIIVDKLTVHPKWEQFRFVLYSVILGFVTYVVYQLVLSAANSLWAAARHIPRESKQLAVWDSLFRGGSATAPHEVAIASTIGAIIGLALSSFIQRKWLFRFAKWAKLTDKYGDENLFTNILNEEGTQFVWVRDQRTGAVYEGRKYAFSEADNVCELVLEDVAVYREGEVAPAYTLHKIYLSAAPGQLNIEIHDSGEEKDGGGEAGQDR